MLIYGGKKLVFDKLASSNESLHACLHSAAQWAKTLVFMSLIYLVNKVRIPNDRDVNAIPTSDQCRAVAGGGFTQVTLITTASYTDSNQSYTALPL